MLSYGLINMAHMVHIKLICLLFLLETVKIGANAAKLDIIEHRPVLLRNKFMNGYLCRAGSYDHERSRVRVVKDLLQNRQLSLEGGVNLGITSFSAGGQVPLDYAYENAKWNLIEYANGEYEIVHSHSNEPLYAASKVLAYDDERRTVLTWKEGPSVTQGFWTFEKLSNGFYMIKNTQHGEYLYATDQPSSGTVFTWRPADKDTSYGSKFHWQLIRA